MAAPFSKDDTNGIETIAVHAGEYIDTAYRASSPNLVMSATFAPTAITVFSALEIDYQGHVYGHVYGRVSSPTVKHLEDAIRPNTKIFWLETQVNPTVQLAPA